MSLTINYVVDNGPTFPPSLKLKDVPVSN